MESRRRSFIFSWIFVFFNLFVSSGGQRETESITLDTRLFVVHHGSDLHIKYKLSKPDNLTGVLHVRYNNEKVKSVTIDAFLSPNGNLDLKNPIRSGEYECLYNEARAYFFVRVIEGPDGIHALDTTEVCVVGVLICVLMVFSVVSSVCVFRGRGKQPSSKGGSSDRRPEQSTEEQSNGKVEEDNTAAATTPSTSFYASLRPHSRSIYDVLDHSKANRAAGQRKAEAKSKESHKAVEQTPQPQDGEPELVYENF
ncbi:NFAT activation molecule 1 [Genypterus blacodes]|uniref:NFAT activation molecule 1 n=1 Tax=Genypterus blacodes TaxID=154954 RepID=UPI003F768281